MPEKHGTSHETEQTNNPAEAFRVPEIIAFGLFSDTKRLSTPHHPQTVGVRGCSLENDGSNSD